MTATRRVRMPSNATCLHLYVAAAHRSIFSWDGRPFFVHLVATSQGPWWPIARRFVSQYVQPISTFCVFGRRPIPQYSPSSIEHPTTQLFSSFIPAMFLQSRPHLCQLALDAHRYRYCCRCSLLVLPMPPARTSPQTSRRACVVALFLIVSPSPKSLTKNNFRKAP